MVVNIPGLGGKVHTYRIFSMISRHLLQLECEWSVTIGQGHTMVELPAPVRQWSPKLDLNRLHFSFEVVFFC